MIQPIENFLSSTEVQKHHQNHTFHRIFPLQKQLSAIIKIQKSMSSHVCVNKKGLVRHVITPRTLLNAHDPKEVSESKQYDLTTHRKNFSPLSKSSPWLTKIQFLWVSNCIIEGIDSWRGIKMQKTMCYHVCVNKKGLVRHAIIPRTLLDAHGPKEVSESKQYDLTTHKNFFRTSQSQRLDSLKSNFF